MQRPLLAWLLASLVAAAACSSCSDDESSANDDPTKLDAGSSTNDGATDSGTPTDGVSDADADADADDSSASDWDGSVGTLTVTSTAFTDGAFIPAAHSCGGAGTSIPIAWSGAPEGTQSYAVVMRDLSYVGPPGNYHWVIWDIPATTTSLPAGIEKSASPSSPAGAKQTQWSFGTQFGYGNMCPPSGETHDYQLSVYAFAVGTLPPAGNPTSPDAVDAIIQAQKRAQGSIVGKYTGP